MSDDWRLRETLATTAQAIALTEALEKGDLQHDLASGATDRVIVSQDDQDVFLYADAREQLDRARQAIEALAGARGWKVQTELRHWHPIAEEWEDPEAPLPQTGAALESEHAERIAQEDEESRERGSSEWEVRVECHSHHDTVALAERLESEGMAPVRRWRYLLVGAADEDGARALADRLTAEAPAGCTVTAEGTGSVVYDSRPPNPFAVLGGLGG